jgi:hypothetical protein
MVAEFWSEITQDNDDQDEEWLYVQEGKGSNLNEKVFWLFFSSWQLKEQSKMELSFCQRLNW